MLRAHMSPDAFLGWKGGMKYNLEVMKHILKISIPEPMQPHDCEPLQVVILEVTHTSTMLLYISVYWNLLKAMLPYCAGYDLNSISMIVHLSWVWLLKAIKSHQEMSLTNEISAKQKKKVMKWVQLKKVCNWFSCITSKPVLNTIPKEKFQKYLKWHQHD